MPGGAFAFEDMPQVAFAAGADDLASDPVVIANLVDCARNPVVKCRPAAARVKLRARVI